MSGFLNEKWQRELIYFQRPKKIVLDSEEAILRTTAGNVNFVTKEDDIKNRTHSSSLSGDKFAFITLAFQPVLDVVYNDGDRTVYNSVRTISINKKLPEKEQKELKNKYETEKVTKARLNGVPYAVLHQAEFVDLVIRGKNEEHLLTRYRKLKKVLGETRPVWEKVSENGKEFNRRVDPGLKVTIDYTVLPKFNKDGKQMKTTNGEPMYNKTVVGIAIGGTPSRKITDLKKLCSDFVYKEEDYKSYKFETINRMTPEEFSSKFDVQINTEVKEADASTQNKSDGKERKEKEEIPY